MNNIEYRLQWTSHCNNNLIEDFMYVVNNVFIKKMDYDYFFNKYINNIYGPSVIVVAYLDKAPVGADALWRNDINGKESYQSADTSVLPIARGKGIFEGMIKRKLQFIGNNVLVYGFPNDNSIKGFLKNNWRLVSEKYTILLWNKLDKFSDDIVDYNYAKWRFVGRDDIFTIRRQQKYWLVVKRSLFLYSIIGELSPGVETLFPTIKGFKILLSKGEKKFYNKNRSPFRVIISPTNKLINIPFWKIDSI